MLEPRRPPELDADVEIDVADGAGRATDTLVPLHDPERLGEWLRQARLRRGQSLDEIERTTRIGRGYLEALEAERYEVLPAPAYVRGFARNYARALGLDPDGASTRLPAKLPAPPGLAPPRRLRSSAGERPRIGLPALPPLPYVPPSALGAVAGALVVAALLWWVVPRWLEGDKADAPSSVAPTAAAGGQPGGGAQPASGAGAAEPGRVPPLIGMRVESAQDALRAQQASFVVVEIASSETPAGIVIGQTPPAGAALGAGDNVTLVVSRGPPKP
jgi:transcriptional regulator with XRE-family HTH domain